MKKKAETKNCSRLEPQWGSDVERGTHLTIKLDRNVQIDKGNNYIHDSSHARDGVNLGNISVRSSNMTKMKRLLSRTHIVHR